jgi:hypothetical protein
MWIKILTFLKTIINSKIFLYAVIGLVIYLWITDRKNLSNTVGRLERNQDALLINSREQQVLTTREFKRLYPKVDSLAQALGIKPKQVQNVIVNNYHYKDSTVVIVPLKPSDTIYSKSDTLKFLAPLGCMKVSGYVINKTLVFNKEFYNDKFHTFLYGERPHFLLGIKWLGYGKWIINSKTYSECLNDIITTESNLKIE